MNPSIASWWLLIVTYREVWINDAKKLDRRIDVRDSDIRVLKISTDRHKLLRGAYWWSNNRISGFQIVRPTDREVQQIASGLVGTCLFFQPRVASAVPDVKNRGWKPYV